MAFNAAEYSQPTYGAGLGTIYQYGHQTPAGPYSFLQNAQGGTGVGGKPPATGASTATATSGPTASAESWMNDVLSGKNLPFSPQQIAAQTTQQTDMNAAAESARNGQLDANAAAGGASATDPSFQGAKAANFARRQTDNSRAAGQITSQANSANFGAQQNAASQLNQNAMQRESYQHQNQGQASGFLPWNQQGHQGGGESTPSFYNFGAQPNSRPGSGGASGLWSGGKPSSGGLSQNMQGYRQTQAWQDDFNRNMYTPRPDARGNYNEMDG